jgi:ubiquinone/menaquinone biosynthesis C-methylase UbiE
MVLGLTENAQELRIRGNRLVDKKIYLHGYTKTERDRLIRQADYWRESLITPSLKYKPGERVLEIGCAVGATMGVLALEYPGVQLFGIDNEPQQIKFADEYLRSLNIDTFYLKTGDAKILPWQDETFDHVYIMWFFEHIKDPLKILDEAYRVLRWNGSITIIESDYSTFIIRPSSTYYEYLRKGIFEFFKKYGCPEPGRILYKLLVHVGFTNITFNDLKISLSSKTAKDKLQNHIANINEFIAPIIPRLNELLSLNQAQLQSGLSTLLSLPEKPNGIFEETIYRVYGYK